MMSMTDKNGKQVKFAGFMEEIYKQIFPKVCVLVNKSISVEYKLGKMAV